MQSQLTKLRNRVELNEKLSEENFMPIGMTPTMSASWGSGGNDFVANPLSIVAVGMNPIGMENLLYISYITAIIHTLFLTPLRKTALVALIRLQPTFASVATLIPLYEDLVATSPDFYDAASDLNYLRLLQGAEISKAAGDAEKLLLIQPDALARISTAALGRLKKGDILGAQALYQGKTIDWSSAPAPWRVVRVAVLRAAGDISNAEKMAATINLSTLRPEEISLFKEGVTDPTK